MSYEEIILRGNIQSSKSDSVELIGITLLGLTLLATIVSFVN